MRYSDQSYLLKALSRADLICISTAIALRRWFLSNRAWTQGRCLFSICSNRDSNIIILVSHRFNVCENAETAHLSTLKATAHLWLFLLSYIAWRWRRCCSLITLNKSWNILDSMTDIWSCDKPDINDEHIMKCTKLSTTVWFEEAVWEPVQFSRRSEQVF